MPWWHNLIEWQHVTWAPDDIIPLSLRSRALLSLVWPAPPRLTDFTMTLFSSDIILSGLDRLFGSKTKLLFPTEWWVCNLTCTATLRWFLIVLRRRPPDKVTTDYISMASDPAFLKFSDCSSSPLLFYIPEILFANISVVVHPAGKTTAWRCIRYSACCWLPCSSTRQLSFDLRVTSPITSSSSVVRPVSSCGCSTNIAKAMLEWRHYTSTVLRHIKHVTTLC